MRKFFYPADSAGPNFHPGRTAGSAAVWRLLLLFLVLALGAVAPARASHFRYGSITWRTVTTDATKRTVVIKVNESFRMSYFTTGTLAIGSVVSNADNLYFGDNANTPINLTVTSVDAAADNFYGEFTVTHTYATAAGYTAYINNSARLLALVNNGNGVWHVQTLINAGSGNSSPVSTLPPVVNLATGQAAATFQLPANDPDGDPLSYSLATLTDLGGNAFTNAPGLAIDPATGVITFPTTGKTVGALYDAIVKVSDGKTSIMVDFIIQITQVSTPPKFDYSITPSAGYVYQVSPGTPVNFTVRATDSDPGSSVTLKAVGLPSGSSMSPGLPVTGNPVTSAFSWTPTASSLGTYVITFVAQDNVGVQTNTSVTIQVSTKPTFDVPPTPANGSVVQITPGTQVTRTIQASNVDPNTLVSIISATGLARASYTPALPSTAGNPTSTQLSWMPVISEWGPHTVTFTAKNTNSSDQKTHSLNFIVNSAPSFTSAPSPASLNVVAGQPFSYSITLTDPDLPYGDELEIEDQNLPAWLTLVDNGDGTGTLSGTPAVSDAGNNPVTLVAADIYHHGASYGLITQSFVINVIPCTVQAYARRLTTLQLDANGQATLTAAQFDDNSTASCGIASMSLSKSSFSCADYGTTRVTLTVTDTYGNISTATEDVIVTDTMAPTAVAQNVTVSLDVNGQASVTAAQVNNGSSDNCGAITTSIQPTQGVLSGIAQEYNALTLTAPAGATFTSVSFASYGNADVVNRQFQYGSCHAGSSQQVVESYLLGQNSATIPAGNALFGDPCYGVIKRLLVQATYTYANAPQASYTCANVGQPNPVTLTVTDSYGNASTATANVTVLDNIAPTIAAPAAVSVSTDAGQCAATNVALGTATAADNCAATVTNDAPAAFPKGTTTVTWTATDAAGNTATATQTVTVTDQELPTLTAPAAVTVSTDAGQCTATSVVLGTATAADNCAGVVVTNNAPATFPKGATTVTYTATDVAGNVATATQVVTVNDTELPTLTAPAAVAAHTDAGQCAATNVALSTAMAADNCPGVVVTNNAPASFPKGTTTVTYTATDAAGNVVTATQTVTVTDQELPTLTAPAMVTVSANRGQCSATNVALGTATAADNCPGVVLTNNAPTTFPKGATTITYTATDASGNVTTATQTVVVNDTELPTIAAPAAVTVSTNAGQCSATNVALGAATAADNCPGVVVTNNAPATYPKGNTTVTWTATDASGNVALATQTVTVRDTELPTITAPAAVSVAADRSQCSASNVTLGQPVFGDNCAGTTVSSNAPATFPKGVTTVTYTATDAAGNVATATQAVTVTDTELPTIAAPVAVSASTNPGQCAATGVMLGSATAADNCPGVVVTNNAPATYPKGVTTVTWKATDAAGNVATATQTVTVRDAELPTITAPVAVLVSTNPGQCAATGVALGTATAADNCPGVVVTNNAPTTFPKGTTTVTYTATDAAGNVATATQVVTVKDTELPTITAPVARLVSTNPGQCAATGVVLGSATAADNCPGVTVTNNAPATFPKGTTTVTWTATDAAGNVATATQTVTVRDSELPTIVAPAAVLVSTNPGQCAATGVALGAATAADNCPGVVVTNNAPASFPKGATTVTWTATDVAGNVATATQTVTVRDMELPTITAPVTVSVSTNPGQCAATGVALGTATAADNCPGVTVTNNAPATFPKGTTTVTYTATDAAGNVATATQVVTVRDTQLPTITAPAAVAANTAAGLCSATVALGTATAADNCPGVVVTNNAPATFPKGTTTVTWTATDAAGNVATATQTVTITDRTAPVALARNVTLPLDSNGQATLAAALVNNGSSDACGIATLTVSPSTFSCSNVGNNPVTLTVTDASGNTSTATAVVTVVDTQAPTVRTRPVTVYLNAAGQATLTATQVNNGSTDACGIASVVVSKTSFGCANLGANTVSLTVTDIRGNVASAPAVVTVADNIAPTLSNLPCNQTALALFNNCSATVCWSAPQAADNCSAVITTSQASGSAFPVGTTTVTITATDPAGNATSYSFTVTVLGIPMFATVTSPTVSGDEDDYNVACYGGRTGSASVCVVGGCLPYSYLWSTGATTASVKNLAAGTYTVVVTDANGAQITRSITLNQAPAITATATTSLAFSGAAPATIYKGYGCQYLTLKAVGDGGLGGYSYRWAPATGLSSTTSCLVTAAPTVTTTYTVTVTDYYGCAVGTASVTVNVVDVRCGSQNTGVTLCYNNQTLCIASGSVATYLSHGAKLGACGSGNTRTSAPELTVETPFAELLLEAYPNPFRSSTTIHFRPVASAPTTVRVYDVLGHVVATLFNEVTEEGRDYTLTLNGEQLAAGIYFCRYESQGAVRTQRLTVEK